MITVSGIENKGYLKSLSISGHAMSATKGKDLVCAAVSAVSFGLCNAVDCLLQDVTVEILENKISIVVACPNEQSDLVMRTALIQLKTIAESNKAFVKIKMEV